MYKFNADDLFLLGEASLANSRTCIRCRHAMGVMCLSAKHFLHTIGYKSDKVVTCLMQACDPDQMSPQPSKRGRHKQPNYVDESVIVDHINSYNPHLSHYRREHTPRRRYLPPEITLKSMFADFMTKQPKFCTYDKYRKVV